MPQNKYKANDDELRRLTRSFMRVPATFDCIYSRGGASRNSTTSAFDALPMIALLTVIRNDTRALFRSLEWTLDDISHESQDDFLMNRRLSEWRKLMNDFEIEIPAMANRFKVFTEFVFSDEECSNDISSIITAIDRDIRKAERKLADAYAGLRADMQFMESRRSITEAKTVTRLTELAFVFIPLSFCASLFSMSIKELENGVPAWIFVVTAIGTITLAYCVRLVVASELLVNSTRRSLERFWGSSAGGKIGADAPVLTIAWFTAQEIWNNGGAAVAASIVKFSCLAAVIVPPLAWMWTSENMGGSFNTAVTLLIVLSIASALMSVSLGVRILAPSAAVDEHERRYSTDSFEDV